jgi:hypothetical protein
MTIAEFLGHLDYLHENYYINAELTANAYATQENVPNLIHPHETDLRIANTHSGTDAPLPHFSTFKKAEITEKGHKLLEKLEVNQPEVSEIKLSVAITDKNLLFLGKVMDQSDLTDIFDARN